MTYRITKIISYCEIESLQGVMAILYFEPQRSNPQRRKGSGRLLPYFGYLVFRKMSGSLWVFPAPRTKYVKSEFIPTLVF